MRSAKLLSREMNALTLLGIDTSGKTASVAVLRDGVILGETTLFTKLTHSQVTLPLVERLVRDCELSLDDIDCVAVSDGPGSYTGLRIGISAVKGICYDGKKCVGVSTLEALAYNCISTKATVFSILAARPNIVYFGAYHSNGEAVENVIPDSVITHDELKAFASDIAGDIIIVGDCAQSIKDKLFADNINTRVASPADRLQKASSVCLCATAHQDEWSTAEALNARYLQITKAEKDLIDGNLKH